MAFKDCSSLKEAEFDDRLNIIEHHSFLGTSLRNIKIPKVRIIGSFAFSDCTLLTDADLSEVLNLFMAMHSTIAPVAIPIEEISNT